MEIRFIGDTALLFMYMLRDWMALPLLLLLSSDGQRIVVVLFGHCHHPVQRHINSIISDESGPFGANACLLGLCSVLAGVCLSDGDSVTEFGGCEMVARIITLFGTRAHTELFV